MKFWRPCGTAEVVIFLREPFCDAVEGIANRWQWFRFGVGPTQEPDSQMGREGSHAIMEAVRHRNACKEHPI